MAQAETIRLSTGGACTPFNSVSESGELNGFDIGNAICPELQAKCEWNTRE